MGVDMLFPRALQFIDNPDKLFTADANQKSPMIGINSIVKDNYLPIFNFANQ